MATIVCLFVDGAKINLPKENAENVDYVNCNCS